MPTAGAADPHPQVGLALIHVVRHQEREKLIDPIDEFHRRVGGKHVVGNGSVDAGQGPELRNPVRIGQEANVEHQVEIAWTAVLEAEGPDRHLHLRPGRRRLEGVLQAAPQVVDTELARVDEDVGVAAHVGQKLAFGGD